MEIINAVLYSYDEFPENPTTALSVVDGSARQLKCNVIEYLTKRPTGNWVIVIIFCCTYNHKVKNLIGITWVF